MTEERRDYLAEYGIPDSAWHPVEPTTPTAPGIKTPAHTIEDSVVGAAILSADTYAQASLIIAAEDFDQLNAETVWRSIGTLVKRGAPLGTEQVLAELTRTERLAGIGGALTVFDMTTIATPGPGVPYQATRIKEAAMRRQAVSAAVKLGQEAAQSSDDILEILTRGEQRLRSLSPVEDDTEELMTLDEFCDQAIPADNWVIPGLMARGDRLMITGAEGLGKTVLMRQFAVCAAAGIHPFTQQSVPAMRGLYIDCENPNSIMVKSFGGIRDNIRRKRGPIVNGNNLLIERRPGGLNLGEAKDRNWLQQRVTLANPDLLLIGPVYKLYRGTAKDKEEDLARQVTNALDIIRDTVNCAMILEHHAGHGTAGQTRDMRPFGSSLWLRWPEFGFGIRLAQGGTPDNRLCDFVPWRGSRDERDWPTQIAAGSDFLPWQFGGTT